jgi:hypothetical protein
MTRCRIAADRQEDSETGGHGVERRTPNPQIGHSRPTANVAILHIGIACCALTMAIVIAVAVAAS